MLSYARLIIIVPVWSTRPILFQWFYARCPASYDTLTYEKTQPFTNQSWFDKYVITENKQARLTGSFDGASLEIHIMKMYGTAETSIFKTKSISFIYINDN